MTIQEIFERFANNAFHCRTRFGIAKPGFSLPLELRLADFYRYDGDQTLADIVTSEILVIFFNVIIPPRVIIKLTRQRGTKSSKMHTAVRSVNIVGETQFLYLNIIVVNESGFDFHLIIGFIHIKWILLQSGSVVIQVLQERKQSHVKIKTLIKRRLFTLVNNFNFNSLG